MKRLVVALIVACFLAAPIHAEDTPDKAMLQKDIEIVSAKLQALTWEWQYIQKRMGEIRVESDRLKARLKSLNDALKPAETPEKEVEGDK